ncbi:hypothetical protein C8J56DRAFT_1058097 [Mycena floridula]|nr:hypothetical protein C8J56DRAFT_1058097 [Mycena floridula]
MVGIYTHLKKAGVSTERPAYTDIADDDLNELVAELSLRHPLAGGNIMKGHLKARNVDLPIRRVQESLRRVDVVGTLFRALSSNGEFIVSEERTHFGTWTEMKSCDHGASMSIAVSMAFRDSSFTSNSMDGLVGFGVTLVERITVLSGESSVIEENDIEPFYVDGKRSTHNIRMERNWRDIRKDTLEFFRQIFKHLEELDLFDLENDAHRICLYIIFQPRIQASLQHTISSWNLHRMRTEHYKTPISIYKLSREKAIIRGYWSGDPGDDIATASHVDYSRESENEPMPPLDELQDDPVHPIRADYTSVDEERNDGFS